jgi:hypothetical protein
MYFAYLCTVCTVPDVYNYVYDYMVALLTSDTKIVLLRRSSIRETASTHAVEIAVSTCEPSHNMQNIWSTVPNINCEHIIYTILL